MNVTEYALEADPGQFTASFPTYETLEAALNAARQPCMRRDDLPPVRVLVRDGRGPWQLPPCVITIPSLLAVTVPQTHGHPHSCRWCRRPGRSCSVGAGRPARFDDDGYSWDLDHDMCLGQDLTRAHVSYYAAQLGHQILPRRNQPTMPTTKHERAQAIADLRRCIDIAAPLWSHRPDAEWLDDARRILKRVEPEAPDSHRPVPESEELTLFGGAA